VQELGRLLFGLKQPVSRRAFVICGFGLMILKYGIDATLVYWVAGEPWTPLDYLNPIFESRGRKLDQAPDWFLPSMVLWTLPFLWIGASMCMRRSIDAGISGWFGLLFFVPLLNYLVMLLLCVLPHAEPVSGEEAPPRTVVEGPLTAALYSVAAGGVLVLGLFLFSVYVNGRYGPVLFLGVPFLLGVCAAVVYNHSGLKTYRGTILVAITSVAISAGALLLFTLEGIVCVAMAFPLALPLTIGGATLGWALVSAKPPSAADLSLAVIALPLLSAVERLWMPPGTFVVVTKTEIDAPPEAVWPNVVRFTELPEPDSWLFRTGVAYPLRARIEGSGVGAVRRCEFSTGAFVEPITVWDEPRRLAFDVIEQPDPMEEWSFYGNVHPPHLDESFRSVRGEFRLVALADGRTRLEGRTWYTLDIHPTWYWRLLSEPLVHAIHARVLKHIKALSEG
jgi:uncharacterized membrane protein YhaH (DUF805 family)